MKILALLLGFCFSLSAYADSKVVNVYAWAGEIPNRAVRQFEKETGIKVNFSTYENNEVMVRFSLLPGTCINCK